MQHTLTQNKAMPFLISGFLALFVFSMTPSACAQQPEALTHYFLSVPQTGYAAGLEMNGQPVTRRSSGFRLRVLGKVPERPHEGSSDIWVMSCVGVTPFVIDGTNTGRLTVGPNEQGGTIGNQRFRMRVGNDRVCELRMEERDVCLFGFPRPVQTGMLSGFRSAKIVCKVTMPDPASLLEVPYQERQRLLEKQESFRFEAAVPVQWIWEDGDRVEELTEVDRKSILAVLSSLGDAYRERDWAAITSLCVTWYGHGGPPEGMMDAVAVFRAEAEGVGNYNDYTVRVASSDRVRLEPGTRVVLASVEKGQIIYAGHRKTPNTREHTESFFAAQPCLGDDGEMHFVRLEGKWRPVLALPNRVLRQEVRGPP